MSVEKFRVFFRLNTHYHNKSVEVVGDFNGWQPGKNVLTDDDGDNVWDGCAELPSGRYEYKFLVDGNDYRTDPNNSLKANRDGMENSVLLVGEARLSSDAIHTGDDIDIFCGNTVYIKARFNRKKFGSAKLILTEKDRPVTVTGTLLYTDEVYSSYYFRFSRDSDVESFLYYFELGGVSGAGVSYFGGKGIVAAEWEVAGFEFTRGGRKCFHTPDWVKDAVFYQIFPDRFFNANKKTDPPGTVKENSLPTFHSFYGGDLEGVIEKTGHLKKLGINAVYFNPIFEAPSVHKYDTSDYRKIDPQFGTDAVYKKMTAAFAKAGIRFILDGVFNHTGDSFWAFRDIAKNGEKSKYKDWYFIRKFPLVENGKPNYDSWWGFASLPKINTDQPDVRKHLLETASDWIKKGASGWRLDVPNEIDHPFWKEFRKTVKTANPDAVIMGEIWQDGSDWLKGDEFDSVMNYRFREACLDFFGKGKCHAEDFVKEIGEIYFRYPVQANFAMLNLLSSHDTARFFSVIKKDLQRMKLAVAFQFTFPGAPCIYYGEEVGMEGGRDPDNRRFMVWSPGKQNKGLFAFYRRMVRIRRDNEPLRRGDLRFIYAKGRTVGFERFTPGGKKLAVFINNSEKNSTVDMEAYFTGRDFTDIVSGQPLKRKKSCTVPAFGFVILSPKEGVK